MGSAAKPALRACQMPPSPARDFSCPLSWEASLHRALGRDAAGEGRREAARLWLIRPSPGSQAVTRSQRTALRGPGWIKIAWAGTSRLPSQPGPAGTWGRHDGDTHKPRLVWGEASLRLGELSRPGGRAGMKLATPPARTQPGAVTGWSGSRWVFPVGSREPV